MADKRFPMNKDKIYFRWDRMKGKKRDIRGVMVPVGAPILMKRVMESDWAGNLVYEMSPLEFYNSYGIKIKSRGKKENEKAA